MPGRQGLVSVLHLNSVLPRERAASASQNDTSGTLTRYPSLPTEDAPMVGDEPPSRWRWMTCKQRAWWSTENVLPRHGLLAENPLRSVGKVRPGEPSLSGEPECLSPIEQVYHTLPEMSSALAWECAFHFFAPSACLSRREEKVRLPQRY
jgi:hypothetical protein